MHLLSFRALSTLLPSLLLTGCFEKGKTKVDVDSLQEPITAMVETDDGEEEVVVGVFTMSQERRYRDGNKNGILDPGESIEWSKISLSFNHNTNWTGFVEFTAKGTGWTYEGDLDLEGSHSGEKDFGVISTADAPITTGTTITTDDVTPYSASG